MVRTLPSCRFSLSHGREEQEEVWGCVQHQENASKDSFVRVRLLLFMLRPAFVPLVRCAALGGSGGGVVFLLVSWLNLHCLSSCSLGGGSSARRGKAVIFSRGGGCRRRRRRCRRLCVVRVDVLQM